MENNQVISVDSVNNSQIQQGNKEKLSDKAKALVSLIVRILVNATLKECEGCDEKGNKISSV
jgi:hypothetical protein